MPCLSFPGGEGLAAGSRVGLSSRRPMDPLMAYKDTHTSGLLSLSPCYIVTSIFIFFFVISSPFTLILFKETCVKFPEKNFVTPENEKKNISPPPSYLTAVIHDSCNAGNEIGCLLANFGRLVVESPEDGAADLGEVGLHPGA